MNALEHKISVLLIYLSWELLLTRSLWSFTDCITFKLFKGNYRWSFQNLSTNKHIDLSMVLMNFSILDLFQSVRYDCSDILIHILVDGSTEKIMIISFVTKTTFPVYIYWRNKPHFKLVKYLTPKSPLERFYLPNYFPIQEFVGGTAIDLQIAPSTALRWKQLWLLIRQYLRGLI